jgi:hypothetical protein
MGAARRIVAAVSLLVLAVSLASPLPLGETRARLLRFQASLAGDPGYRSDAMSFWFDPEYAAFLEEVRRRTPETATVTVLVPVRPDLYRYQAYYRLAPRRVVEERWKDQADVVATYKPEVGRAPGGEEIPGGRIWIRPR